MVEIGLLRLLGQALRPDRVADVVELVDRGVRGDHLIDEGVRRIRVRGAGGDRPAVHPQIRRGGREDELPVLRILDLGQSLPGVAVEGVQEGEAALDHARGGIADVGLHVRGQLVDDDLPCFVQLAFVLSVEAVAPCGQGDRRDLPRVLEQSGRPSRFLLRGVEEVLPAGELLVDLLRVVDKPGGAPRLADRIRVVGVEVLMREVRIHMLEVRDQAEVEFLQQIVFEHLRNIRSRRHDHVIAGGPARRRELRHELLVRSVGVDLNEDVVLGFERVEEFGIVVVAPGVEVELRFELSVCRRRRGHLRGLPAGAQCPETDDTESGQQRSPAQPRRGGPRGQERHIGSLPGHFRHRLRGGT